MFEGGAVGDGWRVPMNSGYPGCADWKGHPCLTGQRLGVRQRAMQPLSFLPCLSICPQNSAEPVCTVKRDISISTKAISMTLKYFNANLNILGRNISHLSFFVQNISKFQLNVIIKEAH